MSLFGWLSSKKKAEKPAPASAPVTSGLSRMDSTRPARDARAGSGDNAAPANRKTERMARRELLYAVVRDSMMRAGVLTTSYKFKVLSLDARGRQFLVMVDLAQGAGSDTTRLAEIEAMVAQQARQRYDILVTAVYWRSIEHVAIGELAARQGSTSRPAPLETASPAPAPQEPAPRAEPRPEPPPARSGHAKYEPLHPDEVSAFKRALANGVTGAEALAAASVGTAAVAGARTFEGDARHGPQSYTLLTGFEDTEMAQDAMDSAPGNLSTTQYGELR
jgi:hypothetical protein